MSLIILNYIFASGNTIIASQHNVNNSTIYNMFRIVGWRPEREVKQRLKENGYSFVDLVDMYENEPQFVPVINGLVKSMLTKDKLIKKMKKL